MFTNIFNIIILMVIVWTKYWFILQRCENVDRSCYKIIQNANGRDDASAKCQSLGGYLALISDDQVKAAVLGFLASYPSPPYYFIDGTDVATEDVWMTETGDVMTYTGMSGSEPNGGTAQNCLGVRSDYLFDTACTNLMSAICEM